MSPNLATRLINNAFVRDYGMIFVLLVLSGLFSILTLKQQHPTGEAAGRQVADFIISRNGREARVLIVTRHTGEDLAFANGAMTRLKDAGATVLDNVNGVASDAKRAIDSILASGGEIDAIAANDVTAKWPVYDRYTNVGSGKCVVPSSYTWPDFLKVSNLLGVANQTAIYSMIAIGMTMVIITGGLSYRLSSGRSIPELPTSFFWLGRGETAGIPNPILLMISLYIIAHVVMSRTVFGRYVYAIGGNAEAARLSGVPFKRILMSVYTICGALAGLGGIVLTSQLSAGDPKFGLMYELEVIAAVVVGGTSLLGGRGKIFGTLIGAFIIAVIKNGMNLKDVDPFNQKIVLGAVLMLAVLFDTLKRRNSRE